MVARNGAERVGDAVEGEAVRHDHPRAVGHREVRAERHPIEPQLVRRHKGGAAGGLERTAEVVTDHRRSLRLSAGIISCGESRSAGSIAISFEHMGLPARYDKISLHAPVAQWTECRPPEPKSAVRVCAGALA